MSKPQTGPKWKTAIVIGAGAGGIAIAARLAKAGLKVTVLEKNSFTGGRCSTIRTDDGFRFDQGPSLLLLPELFRETFADLDTTMEAEGIELLQCMPNYNIWFSDGDLFQSSTDTAAMKRQITAREGPDGFRRYLSFLSEAHNHHDISINRVLRRNFTSHTQLVEPSFVVAGLKIHPLESIWSRASRYFWTDRLRRVFTFATMYMGMSPFDAPSTYSLLQYTELADGIWYPRGGFHAVLAALENIGRRLGVEYRLSTPVAKVLVDERMVATGVRLESGEVLHADVVVVNADLVYAYNNLFPSGNHGEIGRYAADLGKREASCSSISFYWSMSKKIHELEAHNIFLADEYKESFDAIFKKHTLPSDPSFYINVPSRIDPTAAPPNKDSLVALVPVGHLSSDDTQQDWPTLINTARAAVLSAIQARTNCEPLEPLIANEIINTPLTWRARFNLDRGAILGLAHNFLGVLSFRPRTRARGVKGAYFVGASTHPGTGVPVVLAGSKITGEQILTDLGVRVPWVSAAEREKGQKQEKQQSSSLDRMDRPLWVSDSNLFVGGVLAALVLAVLYLLMVPPGAGGRGSMVRSDW